MRVEKVLSLKEYDEQANLRSVSRIPDITSSFLEERLGDCIYDFSSEEPKLRPSVHGPGNVETDLSGKNALLSTDFYYFGRNAVLLPDTLHPIVHQGQGHRRPANEPYFDTFVSWIRNSGFEKGKILGMPDFEFDWETAQSCKTCVTRKRDGETDQEF